MKWKLIDEDWLDEKIKLYSANAPDERALNLAYSIVKANLKELQSPSPVQGVEEIENKLTQIFNECIISLSGPDNGSLIINLPRAKGMILNYIKLWQQSQSNAVEQDKLWDEVALFIQKESFIFPAIEKLKQKYSITKSGIAG